MKAKPCEWTNAMDKIDDQRREIRRLRRALREILNNAGSEHSPLADGDSRVTCLCSWCIATRALKGKGK